MHPSACGSCRLEYAVDRRWVRLSPMRVIFSAGRNMTSGTRCRAREWAVLGRRAFSRIAFTCVEAGLVTDLVDSGFTIDDALSVEDTQDTVGNDDHPHRWWKSVSGFSSTCISQSSFPIPTATLQRCAKSRFGASIATIASLRIVPPQQFCFCRAHFASPQSHYSLSCDGDKFRFLPS